MILYNSLTHRKEPFVPRFGNKVSMYTCGPTVYHFAHIGNLRTYIMEDMLEKALRYEGYDVKRVMNITDVGHLSSDADTGEDKMLKGARVSTRRSWKSRSSTPMRSSLTARSSTSSAPTWLSPQRTVSPTTST